MLRQPQFQSMEENSGGDSTIDSQPTLSRLAAELAKLQHAPFGQLPPSATAESEPLLHTIVNSRIGENVKFPELSNLHSHVCHRDSFSCSQSSDIDETQNGSSSHSSLSENDFSSNFSSNPESRSDSVVCISSTKTSRVSISPVVHSKTKPVLIAEVPIESKLITLPATQFTPPFPMLAPIQPVALGQVPKFLPRLPSQLSRSEFSDNLGIRKRSADRFDLTFFGYYDHEPESSSSHVIRVWVNSKLMRFYDCYCGSRKPVQDINKIRAHCRSRDQNVHLCKICLKTFSNHRQLNGHLRIHQLEKPSND